MVIKRLIITTSFIFILSMILASCTSATARVEATQVSSDQPSKTSLPLQGMKWKVAAVLPGPVNDAGWSNSAYLGLVNLRDKYGMDINYSENVKPEDAEQVLRNYADAGFDLIICHGFEYADAIKKVALEYPKIKFFHTNGSETSVPNLYTVTFSAGEGGYFIGRLACKITKSGKIAYIAGTEFPILSHHIKMSRQACADIDKGDVEIIESYVGSWTDPAKAKELAKAAIDSGVDILILEADAGDPGTIEAAKEAAAAGKYIRVISWVKDKNYLAPDLVIGGWEEAVSRLIEWTVEQIAAGKPGGHYAIGLKDDGVRLNPFYGLVPSDVEKDIVDTLEGYIEDPGTLPNLEVRTDL